MTENIAALSRDEKIKQAKELYSRGSRNYLVKSYEEAADDLSQVCGLYEEIYGEQSDELGMPYLLYAKSLVALALEENKVIDVPEEEDDDDEDDEEDEEESEAGASNGHTKASADSEIDGTKLEVIKETEEESKEADSTEDKEKALTAKVEEVSTEKKDEDSEVSSTVQPETNGTSTEVVAGSSKGISDQLPSTSNGANGHNFDEDAAIAAAAAEGEEDEAASNLQLAWETLELAGKIFSRQGMGALPNLAEVHLELGNIEFENNIPEAAREDYEKCLKIHQDLSTTDRRAMAEIHYKVGLTYLMQQMNDEAADSLKEACELIQQEIIEMKAKTELNEKDKNNILDMEETKKEIWAKITEIEETKQENLAQVRKAIDSVITPSAASTDDAGPSSSSSSTAATSSSKPTDISHLIKRKKPDTSPTSEAEAASPAKRPAV